jgi:hypothetical protein
MAQDPFVVQAGIGLLSGLDMQSGAVSEFAHADKAMTAREVQCSPDEAALGVWISPSPNSRANPETGR